MNYSKWRGYHVVTSSASWIINKYTKYLRQTMTTTRTYTVVPLYPRVICSKTYCGYMKLWIIPNAIYNVIFV
jgi:hypothetical protein